MPVALITGASRGFGRAVAELLARRGWDLIIDARDAAALEGAATALREAAPGATIEAIAGDVTDADHRAALRERQRNASARLDLLVNNASSLGVSPLVPLTEFPIATMPDVFRTNIAAPVLIVQEVLPLLPPQTAPSSTSARTRRSRPTRAGDFTAPRRPRSTSLPA